MERAVFDTDVVIRYSKDDKLAVRAILECPERYVSFTTWVEFLVGFPLADQPLPRQFIVNNFEIVPCDENISDFLIDIRQTTNLKYADASVYATAKYLRVPLVTFNTKHFNENAPDIYVPHD